MGDEEQVPTRRITVELPADVTMSDDELQSLTDRFKSSVIDTKAERMVVQEKPKEKEKQVAVIAQVVEVENPKEKSQTI